MDLLEIINGQVQPSVHALCIEPFKSMWEADTSKGKESALRDFRYVELVCSPKKSNPFFGIEEDIRPAQVRKEVYKNENHGITSDVMRACMKYTELLEHSSPSYALLISSLKARSAIVLDTFRIRS